VRRPRSPRRASSYDPAEDRRRAGELLDRGVQALLVERLPPLELPSIGLDAVVTDHAIGAGMAVRHLARLGHRRIGLVLSRRSPHSEQIRIG
jgi:DNA-binding LacI/PurR family transcriptional regulator